MLEFLACSLVTILPDYMFRRYFQGKRWGHEINLFTVWYELRWGITSCTMLTVVLITIIFFYHPTTSNVALLFRTVSILPEDAGRVEEVFVGNLERVEAGDVLFTLDSSVEQAKAAAAERRIAEVDADLTAANADLEAAQGRLRAAESELALAQNELGRSSELLARGSTATTEQKVEILEFRTASALGATDASKAERDAILARIAVQLPARRELAVADLETAKAELAKKTVFAGVSGTLDQFLLQPGDIVNPFLRPAGIIVPDEAGSDRVQAGFQQITAPVIKVGMIGEITCASRIFNVIPTVVTQVQKNIPSGQFRPSDRLVDLTEFAKPGTIFVTMEPLFEGGLDQIPRGSRCVANAYTNNHDLLEDPDLSSAGWLYLHMVDALAVVHAVILRAQALLLPVQQLVLTGH